VVLEGSSLPPAVVDEATRPFIGRTIDALAASRITGALAAAYAKSQIALYLVQVPAQDFGQDGVLRLRATEGYVGEVVLQGPIQGRDMSLARAYLGKLAAEKPLKRRSLQRYVALIRDIPELNAEVQLKETTELGRMRLEVTARPRTVRFGLAVNNRGTALLGRTQVQGDLNLYSLLRQGDQTRLSLAVPTQARRFQYYSAFHSTPLGTEGTTLSLNLGYLRTRPAFYDLRGNAYSAGVQLSHPLVRTAEKSLYLTAGLDGLNSSNALFGQRLSTDRTRTARLGAAFNWEKPNRYLGASATLSRGLGDVFGGRTLNAQGVDLEFTKLNLRAAFNTRVGKPFVIRLNVAGQMTGDRLPGSEQFALGGEEFGRAYEAALVAGDRAVAGSAEFALRPRKGLPKRIEGSEAYLFMDGGRVSYLARYGFPTQRLNLGSYGGGIRLAVVRRVELQLEAARTMPNKAEFLDRKDTRLIFATRTLF
jgi:hemolysin activation/secretion protein